MIFDRKTEQCGLWPINLVPTGDSKSKDGRYLLKKDNREEIHDLTCEKS